MAETTREENTRGRAVTVKMSAGSKDRLLRTCWTVLCILVPLHFFSGSSGAPGGHPGGASGDDFDLFTKLFRTYKKALRPVSSPNDSMIVEVGVALTHIINMDEKHQTLTANLWLTMGWNDTNLTWNATDYNNLWYFTVPADMVWKPDIVLYQNVDPYFDGWSRGEMYVKVHQDGYILWEIPSVTSSSCDIDVSSFPFDIQKCELAFGPWIHSGYEVDMKSMAGNGSLEGFIDHAEWDILSFVAERHMGTYGEDFNIGTPYADVTFTLELRRKSTFYVFNLLLPCLLLTSIMSATFFLPIDSGEKLSFGVSLLLSMVVFQLVLNEVLPESDKLPWIGEFVIVTMVLMSFSLAMSVFIMNVCDCSLHARPVPLWMQKLVMKYVAMFLLMGDLSKSHDTEEVWESQELSELDDTNHVSHVSHVTLDCDTVRGCWKDISAYNLVMKEVLGTVKNIKSSMDIISNHVKESSTQSRIERQWRTLAKVLDRIFFTMYVLAAFTCLFAFSFNAKVGEDVVDKNETSH
ncbi:neuronal acetylcholine receptor subunit alpha-10-like [Branchiostoma floridae x Branchiostoma belcheri]